MGKSIKIEEVNNINKGRRIMKNSDNQSNKNFRSIKFFGGILSMGLAVLLFANCYLSASFKHPGPNSPAKYRFDYVPTEAKKLKQELTFLLISPQYEVKASGLNQRLVGYGTLTDLTTGLPTDMKGVMDDYTSAMGEDFKEMMTTRGFRLIQMLKDQHSATYGQREQSNFSLSLKVSAEIFSDVTSAKDPSQNIITNQWSVGEESGRLRVKSRLTLEAYEPMTWQLFWVKYLESEELSTDYSYKWNYTKRGGVVVGSDTRPQALASLLERSYNDTMDKLYIYLDPDEFTALNVKEQEIRKKATGEIK
jgi:hypothetical protein